MGTELATRQETGITGSADWQTMRDQAAVLLKSGFLPASVKTAEQALAIMLTGRELGIPPMQALRGIIVIQGSPTVRPEMMLALAIQRTPGLTYEWGLCNAETASVRVATTAMPKGFTSTFTIADARRAGLTERAIWKSYPGNMLRWRALGNALHLACPDVLVGLYTPDELGAPVDGNGAVIDSPLGTVTKTPAGWEDSQTTDAEFTQTAAPQPPTQAQKDRVKVLKKEKFGAEIKAANQAAREFAKEVFADSGVPADDAWTAEDMDWFIAAMESMPDFGKPAEKSDPFDGEDPGATPPADPPTCVVCAEIVSENQAKASVAALGKVHCAKCAGGAK